nr:unnamed protein product [Spirometra erinaceieuropaei]
MWRSIPSPAVQRSAETDHVTTVPTQGSIRPSIQRNPQTLCTRHSAQGPLTWFSPPVETVARGVAAEQCPAMWSHRVRPPTSSPCVPTTPPATDTDFTCPNYLCTFSCRIGLVGRLQIHRTETGEPVPGAPTYTHRTRLRCPHCPRTFTHRMGLFGHMRIHESGIDHNSDTPATSNTSTMPSPTLAPSPAPVTTTTTTTTTASSAADTDTVDLLPTLCTHLHPPHSTHLPTPPSHFHAPLGPIRSHAHPRHRNWPPSRLTRQAKPHTHFIALCSHQPLGN